MWPHHRARHPPGTLLTPPPREGPGGLGGGLPVLGAMGLVRDLRNFDGAGVSDEVAAQVAARISDPVEVARSR